MCWFAFIRTGIDRGAFLLLLILSLALPFELVHPILIAGSLQVTNLECVLYATLFLWGVGRLAERKIYWTRVHSAASLLAGAILVSGLSVGPEGDSLKFALRCLGGIALFFASADLIRTSRRKLQWFACMGLGATAAGALALSERWIPGTSNILMAFKTQPSAAGAFLRATGPFQYANIAAMFWEAMLPILVAAGSFGAWGLPSSYRRLHRAIAAAMALVLCQAILLSGSRAALLIALLLLVAISIVGMRELPQIRAMALTTTGLLLSSLCLFLLTSNFWILRFRTQDIRSWYRAEYAEAQEVKPLEAGSLYGLKLTIQNTGAVPWKSSAASSLFVSYHWLDSTGVVYVDFEGIRTSIPHEVFPGERVAVEARLFTPTVPGRYRLEWDMVQEHSFWFNALSHATNPRFTDVEIVRGPGLNLPPMPESREVIRLRRPDRSELWRAALRIWLDYPFFGIGPDRFRHEYSRYLETGGTGGTGGTAGIERFDPKVHANSLYLELLATLGAVGLACFLGFLAVCIAGLRSRWNIGREQDRVIGLGLGACLAAYLAHGAVDYFLAFTPTYGQFWMVAGVATGHAFPSHSQTARDE